MGPYGGEARQGAMLRRINDLFTAQDRLLRIDDNGAVPMNGATPA